MENNESPDLFNYLDYRHFLKDWLATAKRRYGFSYRIFSKRAGLKSPSLFKMVMDGSRDLIEGSLHKFLEGLHLTPKEKEYFAALVLYNQAESQEARERHLGRVRSLKEKAARHEETFRLSMRLSAEHQDLIKSKIEEFCGEMARLFGRRVESEREVSVSVEINGGNL